MFTDGSYTKGKRAHTHRELIREWLWEPNVHNEAIHRAYSSLRTSPRLRR